MKKDIKLSDIILPSKRINFFVIMILVLGLISGSVFLISLSGGDKSNTVSQIVGFFSNIKSGSIDNRDAFRNSLIINYIFVGLIWGLGLSIIGVIINIFLCYIKGFVVGFSISSIILSYGYKGIIASILYVFPIQVINVIVVMVTTIYSFMFSKNLLGIIVGKKNNSYKVMLKRYVVILIFSIIVSFLSSLIEVYLFPKLLKVIIDLYVK